MSLLYPVLDSTCVKCGKEFDSWSDFQCPYCRPILTQIKCETSKNITIHQKAHSLFQKMVKNFYRNT